MDQLIQLAAERQCQQLAHASRQYRAERLLALGRATHRAERAEWRMRRAASQARQVHAQLHAQ